METPQPTTEPVAGAATTAQPEPTAPAPAATPTEPVSTSQQPAQADETAAWLQSKGINPDDPDYLDKITKMAYNSEKQMTKATQEASELRKTLTPQNPIAQDGQGDPAIQEFIQDYRRDKLIDNFKGTHPDWQQHEPVMAEILKQQVNTPYGVFTRSQLVNEGLMALEDVYLMAKSSAPVNTQAIQDQAQQQVLQTLANTQRAGGGNAHASNSNPQTPSEDPITAAIRKSRG